MSMTANELQDMLRTLPHPKGAKAVTKETRIKALGNKLYMPFLILNFAAIMFFSKVLGYESFIYIGVDRVIFLAMLVPITLKAMAEKQRAVLLADRSETIFFGYASYIAVSTFIVFSFLSGSSFTTYFKEMFQLFFEYFFFFWVIKRVSRGVNIRKLYYVFALFLTIEALMGIVENYLQFNFFYGLIQAYGLPYNHSTLDNILTWGYIRNNSLRSFGTFSQPMEFAGVLTINIPFLLYFMSTAAKKRAKVMLFISLVMSVWAIYVSQTRTAIIIAIIAIALFTLFSARTSKLVKIMVYMALALTPLLFNDVVRIFTTGADDVSTVTRLQNYANGLQIFYHHTLFGVGYGGFDQGAKFHIDNYFLTLLIETGAIGTAMFAFAIIWAMVYFWRRYIEVKAKVFSDYYLTLGLFFTSFLMLNFTFDAMGIVAFGKVFLFLLAIGINFLRVKEKEAAAVEQ